MRKADKHRRSLDSTACTWSAHVLQRPGKLRDPCCALGCSTHYDPYIISLLREYLQKLSRIEVKEFVQERVTYLGFQKAADANTNLKGCRCNHFHLETANTLQQRLLAVRARDMPALPPPAPGDLQRVCSRWFFWACPGLKSGCYAHLSAKEGHYSAQDRAPNPNRPRRNRDAAAPVECGVLDWLDELAETVSLQLPNSKNIVVPYSQRKSVHAAYVRDMESEANPDWLEQADYGDLISLEHFEGDRADSCGDNPNAYRSSSETRRLLHLKSHVLCAGTAMTSWDA